MIHFKMVQYLADRDYFWPGSRIMDVGTQNLMFAAEDAAITFVKKLRRNPLSEDDIEGIKRVCYFSTPRANERTAFLHELLAYTDVIYESIDIVDGLKTTIFDLNFDTVPDEWRLSFDFIINCGTLEHVIHQYKALTFIHDILKPGGAWFDQPPSIGFLNHGYYNYNPLFYLDMASANDYEIIEAWYSHAGGYPIRDMRFPLISVDRLDEAAERAKTEIKPFTELPPVAAAEPLGPEASETPSWYLRLARSLKLAPMPLTPPADNPDPNMGLSYNFNCVMRKTVDMRLRLPLEIRTTHGPVGANVQEQYGVSVFDSTSRK